MKPVFRDAFKRRRCLMVADAFYEWKKTGGKVKQPYFIRKKDKHNDDEELISLLAESIAGERTGRSVSLSNVRLAVTRRTTLAECW